MSVRLKFIFGFYLFSLVGGQGLLRAEALKVHGIFRSNMVLQRDKPITIWGWAPVGSGIPEVILDTKPQRHKEV